MLQGSRPKAIKQAKARETKVQEVSKTLSQRFIPQRPLNNAYPFPCYLAFGKEAQKKSAKGYYSKVEPTLNPKP